VKKEPTVAPKLNALSCWVWKIYSLQER